MANILRGLFNQFADKHTKNVINKAFYQFFGNGMTQYDEKNETYLKKGYNYNPTVFACINKATVKTVSVPYAIKKVKDKRAHKSIKRLDLATKGEMSQAQFVKHIKLSVKAYSDEEVDFPLENPNPNQTWSDIFGLYKTYMKITGNFYLYMACPEDGVNKGVPIQVYVLPSHLVQIVLKKDADMLSTENPISHYILIQDQNFIKFEQEFVIHVKYSNPNFDFKGTHLYGISPLRSALRNINSQNSAIDNNIKTLQSGGAYGFLYGKGEPLTPEQGQSLKEKLIEMDKDTSRLGKIAGASSEVGFQRISLTTDELKPFDYLEWDQKTICNCLNFPDELLNSDGKASLGSSDSKYASKSWITDDIKPDLILLQDALNKSFLPRFKGYEDCVIEWDVTELPEMQEDMKQLAEALEKIRITPNEMRSVFKWEASDQDGMDVVWMPTNMKRIDDVSDGVFDNANL